MKFDPFIAVIFMRKGAHKYDGLSAREWKMFALSILIGDLYWSIITFSGVSLVEYMWRVINV
jgi:hypothetical protein